MSDVRVEIDKRVIDGLLKETSLPLLRDIAQDIEIAAGPGHRVDGQIGPNRARAAVITDSFEAKLAEATDHNLTRAIDAGRR